MSLNIPPPPPPMPYGGASYITITASHVLVKVPARVGDIYQVVKEVVAYMNSPVSTAQRAPCSLIIDAKTDPTVARRTESENATIYEEISYLLTTVANMKTWQSFEFNITNYHESCGQDLAFAAFVHKLPNLARRRDLTKFTFNAMCVASNMGLFATLCGHVMATAASAVAFSDTVKVSLSVLGLSHWQGSATEYAHHRQQFVDNAKIIRATRSRQGGQLEIYIYESPNVEHL